MLFLRIQLTTARNWVHAVLTRSPLRLLSAAVFLVNTSIAVCSIFRLFGNNEFAGHIALIYAFNFFFLALMAMLTLSTAVMIYSSTFRSAENNYLMTLPAHPRQFFLVKFVEAVIMVCWVLLLLGTPMMAALAIRRNVPLSFYPYFAAVFLSLFLLPGSAGTDSSGAGQNHEPDSVGGVHYLNVARHSIPLLYRTAVEVHPALATRAILAHRHSTVGPWHCRGRHTNQVGSPTIPSTNH